MDIRHLKMIKAVAMSKSLSGAASRLFLSQSALSRQLKEIEDYFKVQIFIRQNKQMLLTKAGGIILEASEAILGKIEVTSLRIKALSEATSGEIRISTQCYTSYHWLSTFIKDFSRQYPEVEVQVKPEATRDCANQLMQNNLDLAIFTSKTEKNLDYRPLFRDELVAIIPTTHAWAKLEFVSPDDFLNENFIMYDIHEKQSHIYNMLFREKPPKKLYKVALTEAIIQMVKAGLGVSVMAHWAIRPYIDAGEIMAIPITRKGLQRTWYAGILKNKELTPYMEFFITSLSKHLKQSEEFEFRKAI